MELIMPDNPVRRCAKGPCHAIAILMCMVAVANRDAQRVRLCGRARNGCAPHVCLTVLTQICTGFLSLLMTAILEGFSSAPLRLMTVLKRNEHDLIAFQVGICPRGSAGSCSAPKHVFLQYAFNLFSHNSPMGPNGYNEEEMKMVKETHKIWAEDDVAITATCIRVPIMRAHAESINLEFERDISEEEVRLMPTAQVKELQCICRQPYALCCCVGAAAYHIGVCAEAPSLTIGILHIRFCSRCLLSLSCL